MERLRRSEFSFDLLVEASPSALVLVDDQGFVIYLNKLAEKLFRYERKELIGQKMEVLIPERFRGHHPEYRELFLSHPQTRAMGEGRDLFAMRKDGTEFPAEIGLNPIKTEEGVLVLASIIDITVRRDLEQEIEAKSKELKKQYQKLQQSKEKLKKLNKTKDKFFSIIAHDLKAPFNLILGFTRMLAIDYDSFDESEKRKFIAEIGTSAEDTYELLENLLTWAIAQKEGITINKENLNLVDLVQKGIQPYLLIAQKKKIQVEIAIGKEQQVIADSDTLKIIIGNLISNAIKFTPKGGQVKISNQLDELGQMNLYIADTGIGMNPVRLKKLLSKQGSGSTTLGTNKEQGTGLGLILCKELVEKNGGSIGVESKEGEGTTFIITLPQEDQRE